MSQTPDETPNDLGWDRERDGFMIDHAAADDECAALLRDPTDDELREDR